MPGVYTLLRIYLMLYSSCIACECRAVDLGYIAGLPAYSTLLSCCFSERYITRIHLTWQRWDNYSQISTTSNNSPLTNAYIFLLAIYIYSSCTAINIASINGNVLVIKGYITLRKPCHRPIVLSHNIPSP